MVLKGSVLMLINQSDLIFTSSAILKDSMYKFPVQSVQCILLYSDFSLGFHICTPKFLEG